MLAQEDLDTLMLELIGELLQVPSVHARLVVRELVAQIFMALESDCCENGWCTGVNF